MELRQLISRSVIFAAGLLLAATTVVHAQNDGLRCPPDDPAQERTRYLRSLSLDLQGVTPTVAELEATVALPGGPEALPDGLLDQWLASPEFADRVVRRHRELLWNNIGNVRLFNNNANFRRERDTGLYWRRNVALYTRGDYVMCADEPAEFGPGGEILTRMIDGYPREGYVEVNPYWAPDTTIKVCASDAQTHLVSAAGTDCSSTVGYQDAGCGCGPNLMWCNYGRADDMVLEAMAEDVERRIRQVIVEKRPYTELFTGRTMWVNGPLSFFLRNQTQVAANVSLEPVSVSLDQLPDLDFTAEDTWVPIELGPEHAGILTSPAFLLRFQTNRARAARYFDAFLCEPYQPPPGGLPLADDACNAEPDLQKRCGCKYCHALLEPAGAYWGRWTEQGAGYLNPESFPATRDDCERCARTGQNCSAECRRHYLTRALSPEEEGYLGSLLAYQFRREPHMQNVEAGPLLLVRGTIADNRLPACATQRALEWLLGRPVLPEEQAWADELARELVWSGFRYDELVRAIVTSEVYRRVR